jgi:hypothetical protein
MVFMKTGFQFLACALVASVSAAWSQTATNTATSDLGQDERTSSSTSVVQKVYTAPGLETGNGPSFVTGETRGTGTQYGSSQQTNEPSSKATGTGAFNTDTKNSVEH